MSPKNPDWLPEVRDFCNRASIKLYGWGTYTLMLEAKTPERAAEVSSLLRQFGFEPTPSEDDMDAGVLLLSRNPAVTLAKQPSFNTSRRPLRERVAPAFEALFSMLFFWYSAKVRPPASWRFAAFASVALIATLWDFSRTWGWRLEMSPEELRVQRYFRWSVIPWSQIRAVESGPAVGRGSNREVVRLTLASNTTFSLGVFGYIFARVLRNRLRNELVQRRPAAPIVQL